MPRNEISQANRTIYGDGEAVEDYLQEKDHQLRLKIVMKEIGLMADFFRKKDPIILDIGAGAGAFTKTMKDWGAKAIACDMTEVALRAAHKKGLDSVAFDVSDDFPFKDNSVDFVYSGELIEHVFDTRHFLNECFRVIKPGGHLFLTTPNLATLGARFRLLRGEMPKQINPFHRYLHTHIRFFTASSLDDALKRTGFGPTFITSQCLDEQTRFGRLYSRFLGHFYPTLGKTLIALAFKNFNAKLGRRPPSFPTNGMGFGGG